jgi:D-serine deaminase-like pyridoxal phosphate-dependent protein
MRVADLDTPAAVVDLDRLEANIAGLQKYLDAHGLANRPHIKTHKVPAIAQMQMRAGAAEHHSHHDHLLLRRRATHRAP